MYFKVYLLRHGKTEGNLHRQYVGVTDQPLCQQGRQEILGFKRASKYPNVDHVFISPLLRCRQTMEMIFENIPFTVVPEFRECNFGNFECRTYEELKDDPQYGDG
jgi:alpha-ribazole phosphatase